MGREHVKYELRREVENAFTGFTKSLDSTLDDPPVETTIAEPETNTPASRTTPDTTIAEPVARDRQAKSEFGLFTPILIDKRISSTDYREQIIFDIKLRAVGIEKATRAVKGTLQFTDLFGETQYSAGWTVDEPVSPGETYIHRGAVIEYNQFLDSHNWLVTTDLKDMGARFKVSSIIYQGGTRQDF